MPGTVNVDSPLSLTVPTIRAHGRGSARVEHGDALSVASHCITMLSRDDVSDRPIRPFRSRVTAVVPPGGPEMRVQRYAPVIVAVLLLLALVFVAACDGGGY